MLFVKNGILMANVSETTSSDSSSWKFLEPPPVQRKTTFIPHRILNTFYAGCFVKYIDPQKNQKYVQIAKVDKDSVTVKHKVIKVISGTETVFKPQFSCTKFNSLQKDTFPDDVALVYDSEEHAHFLAKIVSLEKDDINLDLLDTSGYPVPYFVPLENRTGLNDFERIIPIHGPEKLDILKGLNQSNIKLDTNDEFGPYTVTAYHLT